MTYRERKKYGIQYRALWYTMPEEDPEWINSTRRIRLHEFLKYQKLSTFRMLWTRAGIEPSPPGRAVLHSVLCVWRSSQLLQQNFNRLKRCILVFFSYGTYINSCFEWESAQRSILSFVVGQRWTRTSCWVVPPVVNHLLVSAVCGGGVDLWDVHAAAVPGAPARLEPLLFLK